MKAIDICKRVVLRANAIENAPSSARNTLHKAYTGNSRAAGVKAFCLRCVGYVRADVRGCTALACPLHDYRPYTTGDDEEETEQVA